MEPFSTKPRPRRIAAVLVSQIWDLDEGDARRIETAHRVTRMDENPAFHIAVACLGQSGRERDWKEAQAAIWDAISARDLPQRVRYAAYDAALALLTRDLIDNTTFIRLYGPWAGARDEHVLIVG